MHAFIVIHLHHHIVVVSMLKQPAYDSINRCVEHYVNQRSLDNHCVLITNSHGPLTILLTILVRRTSLPTS